MRILRRTSGRESVESTSMMAQASTSSMSSKALWFLRFMLTLPLGVGFSIAVSLRGFAIDVVNVISAPGLRLDVVLHAAETPLFGFGERISRDEAQKLDFLAVGALRLDALHQDVQRFGIAER